MIRPVSRPCPLKHGTLDLATLREWRKGRLSVYKIPQRLKFVRELPRNAMGKVTKLAVKTLFGLWCWRLMSAPVFSALAVPIFDFTPLDSPALFPS